MLEKINQALDSIENFNTLWNFLGNCCLIYLGVGKFRNSKAGKQLFSRDMLILIAFLITGFVIPGVLLFNIIGQEGSFRWWDWVYIVINAYVILSAIVLVFMVVATERFIKDSKIEDDNDN